MKTHSALRLAIASGACLIATVATRAQTEAPTFANRAFVGDYFFLGFFPKTADWISVESSLDLKTWTPVASVATTNGVTEFVEEDARGRPFRFYRLRQPGMTVEEAETRWLPHGSGDYRFQLLHVRSHVQPYVLSATVTVRGGQKAISNAEADGQLLEQPDPGDFPTVVELFAALKQAQEAGCSRVAVIYDEARGFPLWGVIERAGNLITPKQVDQYWITELTSIATGQGV